MKTFVSVFAALSSIVVAGLLNQTVVGQSSQFMVVGTTALSSVAPIQSQSSTYRPPQTQQVALSAKLVGYRATDWNTVHTYSKAEAEQTLATLKRIGCEVETNNHGDHVDIKFRCEEWRSMKVKTHTLQSQWSNWCEKQGMETVVVNPPVNTKRPTVAFQMATPRTVHLHDHAAAQKIMNTLTLIGCELKTVDHNGHTDATFSCPQWKTIELATEDRALAWQEWLKESGFETTHANVQNNEGSGTVNGAPANGNDGSATQNSGSATQSSGSATRTSGSATRTSGSGSH